MITFLHGKLVEALPTQVVVDVQGVGYEALIPLSSFDKLPQPGGDVKLLTQLIVREDAHVLYGFATAAERIVVELRDKIGAAGAWEAASAKHALSPDDQKINDAVLALMALGFKQIEAHDSVRAAQTMLGAQATVEQ